MSATATTPELTAEIDELVQGGLSALSAYADYDQARIDYIVKKASVAALSEHMRLAQLAVQETRRGVVEDKAVKNIFACEHVSKSLRHLRTVGVIGHDELQEITEIAEPVGVIAGITPVTNPTSTTIFKALLALKTRNPIVFAFHPSAQQSSAEAARVLRDAAIAAGAPEHCVQWIEQPSIEATGALMNHPGVATVLATGGNAMVTAAYSTGKPALGVGAGNVPAYIEKSADVARAVNDIVLSKSFDNGMICASEQAAIIDAEIYEQAMAEFRRLHAYRVNSEEKALLEQFIFGACAGGENCSGAKLNAAVVGQPAAWIAEQAGFTVPAHTSIILAEVSEVSRDEPLTREKLCPVLAVLRSESTEEGIRLAQEMVELDGLGHSAAIHTSDEELTCRYGQAVKAIRVIANSPSSHGGIGGVYNAFIPSLTLGCGSYGRNSVAGNVSACHLLNVKRVGARQNNMQWFKVPPKIYFERNSIRYLYSMPEVSRVTIVTDHTMTRLGYVDRIIDVLSRRENRVALQIIDDVEPEPSVETVERGAELMRSFHPDTIIALGGGSPMDAAKVMWLKYEHPDACFDDLREKFVDIRKRAFQFPDLGALAKLVCIPTTSGSGSEVTPFAVITDTRTGRKYPLADYALTPHVAIVDPTLTAQLPPVVTADSGIDVLVHAIEAYTSVYANDFTDGLALQAIRLVFEHLERAVKDGSDKVAREKMHNAGTIAGMAFANAFLGLCHATAHTIGARFHIAHGRTNGILLPHVIRHNGQVPSKLTSWPKYERFQAPERFAEIARMLGLDAATPEQAVQSLARGVERLRERIGIPSSFSALGISEAEYMEAIPEMAIAAYEDQCAGANPRMPMLSDIQELMRAAF
jgi:acetaldehyde dehydrogenase / alcohol dehydrogenase